MTFIEKLEKVQKLFNQTCTCFIVFGENILVTSKGACFVAQQDNPEDYESVSQIFSISDSLAEYLGKYYREAFRDSIVVNSSQFYVADIWEAKLISAEAMLRKTGWNIKWVDGGLEDVLNSLAWLNPMNPHQIALKANILFNKELYAVYDVMKYQTAFEKYDIGMIIDLIRRRYISICSLPIDILTEVNKRLDQCELTEYDIISMFKADVSATKERVRNLKPQDILLARIQAISTFNRELDRLMSEAGIDIIAQAQYEIVEGFAPDLLPVPEIDLDKLEQKDNVAISDVEKVKEHPLSVANSILPQNTVSEVTNTESGSNTVEGGRNKQPVENIASKEEDEKTHVPRSERGRYARTESLEL